MCQQDQAGESILYVAVNADADLQNYTTQLSPLVAAVSVSVARLFSASVGQVHAPENLMSCPPSNGAYPETERTGICKKTSRQQADCRSCLSPPLSNIPRHVFWVWYKQPGQSSDHAERERYRLRNKLTVTEMRPEQVDFIVERLSNFHSLKL